MIHTLEPPLNLDEEYVSYDIEALFTNVPIHDTIEYILDEVYVRKKLPELCKRSIFKKLLLKLTTESTFMFDDRFYKQKDGCTMGGPLSVIISDIFMTKLEKQVVSPAKPTFYKRYVDDIITRRKKNQPDELLNKLMSFHPKIKFTVEVNLEKFLTLNLFSTVMVLVRPEFTESQTRFHSTGIQRHQYAISEMPSLVTSVVLREYLAVLKKRLILSDRSL